MKVTFYKFGSNIHGFYVQTDIVWKEETMSKRDIIKLCDPYMGSKKDYYETQSHDIRGVLRPEVMLLGWNFTMIVHNKMDE